MCGRGGRGGALLSPLLTFTAIQKSKAAHLWVAVAGLVVLLAASPVGKSAQASSDGINADKNDIGWVVCSAKGPEAGV